MLRVAGALIEIGGGKVTDDSPESRAGRRVASIPPEAVPEPRVRLEMFAEPGEYGRVFTGPDGGPLKHSGFRRTWDRTVRLSDFPAFTFMIFAT